MLRPLVLLNNEKIATFRNYLIIIKLRIIFYFQEFTIKVKLSPRDTREFAQDESCYFFFGEKNGTLGH